MVRRFSDVLQYPAEAGGHLVVAADALNILPIVTDVEVVDGKVDQLGLISRSSVELGERRLILRGPRVVFGHETAEVLLALGYGLLPPEPVWSGSYTLLKLDNLVVLHMVECYTIGQDHLDLLTAF
jgi:hypothetical protein